MHRLIRRATRRTSQPTGRVLHREHDAAFRLLEVHVNHSPRRDETESLREERFHHLMRAFTDAP